MSLLADLRHEYARHKRLVDEALSAIPEEAFFTRPAPQVNPIALIVKHIAGNLLSRWTDFLTTDGDKPTRDRDGEFLLTEDDTPEALLAAWNNGWQACFSTIDSLQETDLNRIVMIRGESHTVQQALLRGATHVSYHVGQILYLARLLNPESRWLTIAPGASRTHSGQYRKG